MPTVPQRRISVAKRLHPQLQTFEVPAGIVTFFLDKDEHRLLNQGESLNLQKGTNMYLGNHVDLHTFLVELMDLKEKVLLRKSNGYYIFSFP